MGNKTKHMWHDKNGSYHKINYGKGAIKAEKPCTLDKMNTEGCNLFKLLDKLMEYIIKDLLKDNRCPC